MQQQETKGMLNKMIHKILLVCRLIELTIYYIPLLLVLPLYWWNPNKYEDWLLHCLVLGIRNSGSVIIKLA